MSRLSDFSPAPEFLFRFHFASIRRLAVALSLFAAISIVNAQEESATAVSRQVKEIFERAAKAVVKIHGVDEHCRISEWSQDLIGNTWAVIFRRRTCGSIFLHSGERLARRS